MLQAMVDASFPQVNSKYDTLHKAAFLHSGWQAVAASLLRESAAILAWLRVAFEGNLGSSWFAEPADEGLRISTQSPPSWNSLSCRRRQTWGRPGKI